MSKKAKILFTGYIQGLASGLMLAHIFYTLTS